MSNKDETAPISDDRPKRWATPAVIAALAVAGYVGSLRGAFVFDDFSNIVDPASAHAIWPPAWLDGSARPVVSFTFALCWVIGGGATWPFHVFNVAVHAANALLVWTLMGAALASPRAPQTARKHAAAIALWTTVLWSTHPLHTSAVTYVVHRYETVASLFYLASVIAFLKVTSSTPRRPLWLGALCLSAMLASFSKETAVTLPLALLLVDATLVSGSLREITRRHRLVHLVAAASCGVALLAVAQPRDVNSSQGFSLTMLTSTDYARSQLGVIAHYFKQIVWPSGLCIDYFDWPVAHSVASVMPSALVTSAALAATVFLLWKQPAAGLACAWFFVILAPTSTVLPLAGELVAERRVYLAMLGPAALAGFGLCWWSSKRATLATVAGALAVGGLLSVTMVRNAQYCSTASILGDNVAKRPDNPRVRYNYGNALKDEGDIARALDAYRACVRSDPGYMDCYGNAVVASRRLGLRDPWEGTAVLEAGEEQAASQSADALIARADTAMRSGRRADTMALLREATVANPRSAAAYHRLAQLLVLDPNPSNRRGDQALVAALRGWALRGNVLDAALAEALAASYAEVGRFDDAIRVTLQLKANLAAAGMQAAERAQQAHADAYLCHERWSPLR